MANPKLDSKTLLWCAEKLRAVQEDLGANPASVSDYNRGWLDCCSWASGGFTREAGNVTRRPRKKR